MARPLTPPDCDLRDFGYMPLDVRRLRDSSAATAENPEEFRAAVLLWCAAWHQVPAGSLPDNDRELSSLAGFGRFMSEWLKVRDGALRGFILCDDGRLYHRVVCEKALEAWIERLQHRRRSAIGNAGRKKEVADTSEFDAAIADMQARLLTVTTAEIPYPAKDSPQGSVSAPYALLEGPQGKGREGKEDRDADASLPTEVGSETPPEPAKPYPDLFEAAWKAYPHVRGRSSKPKALGLWRRLPPATREALPSAAARYARDGREPKAECGAPGMDRWLSSQRYTDWISDDPGPLLAVAPDPDRQWRYRLTNWTKNRFWNDADWGPRPTQPGCGAPASLMAEFGLKPVIAPVEITSEPRSATA